VPRYKLLLATWCTLLEKAGRLHRLNNETGEPVVVKRHRKKSEAGEKTQAAQNCKTEAADDW
jgi:hypothetical protein